MLLSDWLALLDGADWKAVIFLVICGSFGGGWKEVIFRVIFVPKVDDSRPEVEPEVVSEEPEEIVAGFENGLAVCFALGRVLF